MITIKQGTEIDFSNMKVGETNGKTWAYVIVKDKHEGSKDSLLVFIENAESAKTFSGLGRVESIVSVKKSARKMPDGSWKDSINPTVIVSGRDADRTRQTANNFDEFMQMPSDDDIDALFK